MSFPSHFNPTKNQLLAFGAVMQYASEVLSNRSSNDLDDDIVAMLQDDKAAFSQALLEWNNGGELEDFDVDHLPDWMILQFAADWVRHLAEGNNAPRL